MAIDLQSSENLILLNPRLSAEDYRTLYQVAEIAQQERQLKEHVWIATSGSTADSVTSTKLVAISKNALKASAKAVNDFLEITEKDIWAQVLPHFHVGGLGIEIRAQLSASLVINALDSKQNNKWDASFFYKNIQDHKCTLSALVPAQVYDLVTLQLKAPSCLRAIVIGGGAMDVNLYKQARQLGWPLLPSYGMTETSSQIATASLRSLDSVSFDFEYPDMQLIGHAEVRTTAEGFLQIRGSSLFTCYAQKTAEGIKHWDPKLQGWFTSEDRGEVITSNMNDHHKILKILGRTADYIRIGGEGSNVAALRVVLEQVALDLNPAWPLRVCVLDMPSERLGSEIHMVTTLNSEEADLIAKKFCEKVMPYEKIRKIYFIDEIPRTDLGKIQWSLLRGKLC